jgi:hypothetical protein
MVEFFNSSTKAKEMKVGLVQRQAVYPWKDVPVGKSFVVPRDKIKFNVLRSLASKTGKKLGRRFVVVDHGEGAPYEVAFIEYREGAKPSLIEALNREKENGTGKEEPSSEKESE